MRACHAAGLGSIPGRVIFWLRFFRGFPSTIRQMSGNLGHIRPRLSYGHHRSSKPQIIHPWMAMVSDHSCTTWSSLNNKQQQQLARITGTLLYKPETECGIVPFLKHGSKICFYILTIIIKL